MVFNPARIRTGYLWTTSLDRSVHSYITAIVHTALQNERLYHSLNGTYVVKTLFEREPFFFAVKSHKVAFI
jgi:hypothetical protein